MRTLIIGDIHGGLRALIQLLERANVTKEDHLIFLGDYVDGWSESAALITYLIELNRTNHCVFIKGNHDIWCEEWLRTNKGNPIWLLHGGQLTVDSYNSIDKETKLEHIRFFERMPLYHISKENNLFIHAGFSSMHGPDKETYQSNYNWDRTLWEMAVATDTSIPKVSTRYPQRLCLFSEIYIGHTPTTRYGSDVPMKAINVWNVDTGAAFEGKLSCIDLDSKEIFQSDPVYKLYPNETGRNKK